MSLEEAEDDALELLFVTVCEVFSGSELAS